MSNIATTNHLYVELKDLIDDNKTASFQIKNESQLHISGIHKRYYLENISLDDLSKNLKQHLPLQVTRLSAKGSNLLSMQGRPISELMWMLAFHAPNKDLLPGCRRHDAISLSQWPNLTRVNRTRNSIRLATLLTARPTSLDLAGRILDIPTTELFQFYNAASYSGLAKVINRREDDFELRPHKQAGLLRKLVSYLRPEEQGA